MPGGASSIPRAFRFTLDADSGVPVYRQIIDLVLGGIASGALAAGHQLPTVRQLAVDLAINPNTVIRAYRELELRGVLDTQQGTGTFVARQKVPPATAGRARRLNQLTQDFAARCGAEGFTVDEMIEALEDLRPAQKRRP
ncbi:MAG: GntR family transcriptional regulator [Bryobacterales bacterium]|nr:GntR family transcriptional regulator [Bryobacterales bacterium]